MFGVTGIDFFFSGVDSFFPEISNVWGPVPKWCGSHLFWVLLFFWFFF